MDRPATGGLEQAVSEVLETMFFLSVIREIPGRPAGEAVFVNLRFDGQRPGSFSVAVSRDAAIEMSGRFPGGEEEPEGANPEEVVCELANVLCGSFLSLRERGAHWEIGEPACVAEFPEEEARRSFELEIGWLEAGLTIRE